MAEKTKLQIQIEASAKRIQEEQRKLKALEKEQRERNDKARTNRLCKRHGLLESVLPVTIALTEEQYEKFVKQHIANKHGIAVLATITGQTSEAVTAAIEDAMSRKRNKSSAANTAVAADTETEAKPQTNSTPAPTVAGQNHNGATQTANGQNHNGNTQTVNGQKHGNHSNQQSKQSTPNSTTPATTQGATA